jgi:transposase
MCISEYSFKSNVYRLKVVLLSMKKPVVFKDYLFNQPFILPPSLDELIVSNHPVRVVSHIIEQLNLQPLLEVYKGGGCSSYHPKMLLKIVVYGYMTNVYSSRKLEEACKSNINFMWLAALNTPDHNTINTFRSTKLQEPLKAIFTQVVELLAEEGLLSIKELYTDGTKIEANANKYTFVWGKAIKTNKEKMAKQLEQIWEDTQRIAAIENKDTSPIDFTTIDQEKIKTVVCKIEAAIENKSIPKKLNQKLNYIKKNYEKTLDKYDAQQAIMGEDRNSYSKTDEDATFMRMKEDHMKNGQLKPAYNVQASTNNQFVVNYTVHQNTTDTNTLIAHLEDYKESYNTTPTMATADAGYGSEENYEYLQQNNIETYVKYGLFDREQNETIQSKKPFTTDKLFYNEKEDYYICPMGQKMLNIGTHTQKTSTGFKQTITNYQARNCSTCPLNGVCHKSKGNRIISINHNLNKYKQQAKEYLQSEEGVAHRKKRCYDTEPVWGNIKSNHHFKRFMLRGTKKVTVEVGLLSLAQNLRKKAAINTRKAA